MHTNHHSAAIVLAAAALAGALAPAHAQDVADEAWNAHFQGTYIWQKKPAFTAAYTGVNSLRPEAEKSYSLSATAAFGWRPWAGGELYFDPELAQGVPLSDLTGLGGMSNGEQEKSGGPNPVLYRARLFLRQSWGLGGEREAVASDANQLAGMVDQRRVVVTFGNLALVDLFDNSAFAHDGRPRSPSSALVTPRAHDFAADARGYTSGAAVEYFYDDWAARAGRFMLPVESNGLALDTRLFKHFGDQIELEHAHKLGGQAGKLRLLAFRNRAVMGSFRDALADAAANGGTPDVARVRRERAKLGFGVNLEQNLTADTGVFARSSWSDGASETYSFAEIDRSLSAGAVVKGRAWGRAEDAVGVALAANGLSRAHRDYLAAGGHGAFIGDGALRYRPETILEAYYNVDLTRRTVVSLDYQRIANPAYNRDRGPVTVASIRLHAQY